MKQNAAYMIQAPKVPAKHTKKSRANKFALPIILRIIATKKVTQKNLSELTRVFNRLRLRKREASAALPKFIFFSF